MYNKLTFKILLSMTQVLVEYDKEDWTTREWLRIHDGSWKIFLVEKTMVWSQRPDPSNSRQPLLWPALVTGHFYFNFLRLRY